MITTHIYEGRGETLMKMIVQAPSQSSEADDVDRNFVHLTYDFLRPDKIRDADMRHRSDPDYDPRTLYLQNSFLEKQTPVSYRCSIV